jgi:hypothetical protein
MEKVKPIALQLTADDAGAASGRITCCTWAAA